MAFYLWNGSLPSTTSTYTLNSNSNNMISCGSSGSTISSHYCIGYNGTYDPTNATNYPYNSVTLFTNYIRLSYTGVSEGYRYLGSYNDTCFKIINADTLPEEYFTLLSTKTLTNEEYKLKDDLKNGNGWFVKNVICKRTTNGTTYQDTFYQVWRTDNGNIYGIKEIFFYSYKNDVTGSTIYSAVPSWSLVQSSTRGYYGEYKTEAYSTDFAILLYDNTEKAWKNDYIGTIKLQEESEVVGYFSNFLDENTYQKNTKITIKNSKGETLAETEQIYEVKQAYLSLSNNVATLTLTDVLNTTETVSFNVEPIKDKRFLGLGTNNKNAIIPLDTDTTITLNNDVILYLVYQTYRPIDETFDINLYHSSAEEIRVDKTDYLTLISTLKGALRDIASITNLSLEIYYEGFPNFNYVYIEAFNRYYYVTDITSIRNNLWEISLSIDVLMSYKDGILQLKGFVERNETVVDNYIVDKKRVIQEGYTYSVDTINNDLFDSSAGSYIITGFMLSQNTATDSGGNV